MQKIWNPPVFWLRGHVGTGKSSLASIIVEKQLENLGSNNEERLGYFYYCGKTHQPSEPLEILQCLLTQLARSSDGQTLAQPIIEMYKRATPISGSGKPSVDDCVELLKVLPEGCPRVTIIIDALDECFDWWTLIASLKGIMRGTNRIRHFLTSRMHVEKKELIPDCATIGPEDNVADVKNYIKNEIKNRDRRLLRGKFPELEQRLINVMIERSENM